MSTLFFTLSVAGFLAATVVCPLIALAFCRCSRNAPVSDQTSVALPVTATFVIPAHNEEAVVATTIQSVREAIDRAVASGVLSPSSSIRVGSDGSRDRTVEVAESAGAVVSARPESFGKWRTLTRLIGEAAASLSSHDLIVCVDAGSVLPPEMFVQLRSEIADLTVIGIAPSYLPRRPGAFERLHWAFERALKRLENLAGGPVSVHGACVIYRMPALVEALKALGDGDWLNDDVVIPLMMRLSHPAHRLVYRADLLVSDLGEAAVTAQVDERRRERMMRGNVQWIRSLLPLAWNKSLPAMALSFRRIFRLLWAYWLVFGLLGVALVVLTSRPLAGVILILLGGLFFAQSEAKIFHNPTGSRILAALRASLLAPRAILSREVAEVVWK